jgi:steroid delta-isomerase-like uncharacterized protein
MRHVTGLGSILILAATMLACAAEAAQEAPTPAALAGLPAPIAAWAAAWEAGDVDGILAAYADDAVLEDVAFGEVFQGKDEIRSYLERQIAASDDISVVTTTAFADDDWVATEWTLTGTYTGQLPGLPPGQGQQIVIRGAGILELEDGLIRADREYWDAYAFLVAAGALPAPEGAETPAA